jgi:hypothetical protein
MAQDNIRLIMKELPADYEADSVRTGAMRRKSGVIRNPADLMWLLLAHLSLGASLAATAALSSAAGLGTLSAVAVMKRLVTSNAWLQAVLSKMAPQSVARYLAPKGLDGYRVLAVDTSYVMSGVSKFAKRWCLHFALDLRTLCAAKWKITDDNMGETLRNFDFGDGDLVLGDRAYSTFASMSHCLSQGAEFILRLRSNAFLVYGKDGQRIDLLARLREAPANRAVDIPVWVEMGKYLGEKEGPNTGRSQLRICALRKSEEAFAATLKKIDRWAYKKQMKRSEEAREFNGFFVVVTSLPKDVSAREALAAYRYRWQVELYFKRFKSLLGGGEIPKKRDECMEAWLNGKMLLAMLIEVCLSKADFSPLD